MNMPVHTDSSSVWDTLPHVVSRTQFCQYSYLFSKHRALHFIPEFTFIIALGKTSSFFRKMFLKFLLRYDSLTTELTVLFTYLLAVLGLHCCVGFSLLGWAGATLHCSAWASHCGGFSCCSPHGLSCAARNKWQLSSLHTGWPSRQDGGSRQPRGHVHLGGSHI